jgi:hypothetical protein
MREKLVPTNGEINPVFGVYKSLCCGYEIVVRQGARFPECPLHPKVPAVWNALEVEVRAVKVIKKTNSEPAS